MARYCDNATIVLRGVDIIGQSTIPRPTAIAQRNATEIGALLEQYRPCVERFDVLSTAYC